MHLENGEKRVKCCKMLNTHHLLNFRFLKLSRLRTNRDFQDLRPTKTFKTFEYSLLDAIVPTNLMVTCQALVFV